MKTAIVIPTCDRPALLPRAVASVRSQNRKADVIVVVNDGHSAVSVDGATVVSTSGWEGLAAARRLGVQQAILCGAEAIGYLDDDDELLPNHIELLAKEIEYGAAFAFSRAIFRYANGFETEDPEPNNHSPSKKYYNPSALAEQNIAPVSSYMHASEAYEKVGGWDKRVLRLEDWDLWGRLFVEFGAPRRVEAVTNVIYRGHGPNLTTSSPLGYSMCCSWRDIVSDRIKYLSKLGSGSLDALNWGRDGVPRVGVVMPVYNAAKYLRQSMDSLMGQTYQDFEVLAINDGSTDDSRKILEEYASLGKVRIFDMPQNSGVAKALNYGLLVSRSEYIARMDADDVAMPERFAKQVSFMDNNRSVGIAGSRFLSMDEGLEHVIWDNHDIPLSYEAIKEEMPRKCCIGHPTVMMRRRVVETIGGYSEDVSTKHCEDYDLWIRAMTKFRIENMPDVLLHYRTHPAQASSKFVSLQRENVERLKRHGDKP